MHYEGRAPNTSRVLGSNWDPHCHCAHFEMSFLMHTHGSRPLWWSEWEKCPAKSPGFDHLVPCLWYRFRRLRWWWSFSRGNMTLDIGFESLQPWGPSDRLPVCSLCFVFAVDDLSSQLSALPPPAMLSYHYGLSYLNSKPNLNFFFKLFLVTAFLLEQEKVTNRAILIS